MCVLLSIQRMRPDPGSTLARSGRDGRALAPTLRIARIDLAELRSPSRQGIGSIDDLRKWTEPSAKSMLMLTARAADRRDQPGRNGSSSRPCVDDMWTRHRRAGRSASLSAEVMDRADGRPYAGLGRGSSRHGGADHHRRPIRADRDLMPVRTGWRPPLAVARAGWEPVREGSCERERGGRQ